MSNDPHARLWFTTPDRSAAIRSALVDLLALRARERARQADHRNERSRVTKQRELGADAVHGLTIREIDDDIEREGTLDERSVCAAIAMQGPVDADDRDAVMKQLAESADEDFARAAWEFAARSVPTTAEDWDGDRPSEQGREKLRLMHARAHQAFLMLRGGYGSIPLGDVNGWWLVNAQTHLSNAEIGQVLVAADAIGPGDHDAQEIDRVLARCAPVDEPRAGEKKKRNTRTESDLARLAVERMRTIKARGFGDVRQTPATRRPQLKR